MHIHTHTFLNYLHLPHTNKQKKRETICQFGFANKILKQTNQKISSIIFLAICKISICIIVYRLRVTILSLIRPTHVQLNNNTLIHISHQQYAIQIIRTVAPKDHPIRQQLNADQLRDLVVIIIPRIELQPWVRVQVIIATVQQQAADCHTELRTAIIHTVSKPENL